MKKLKEQLKNNKVLKLISFLTLPLFIWVCLLNAEYLNYGDIFSPFVRWGKGPGKLIFAMFVLAVLSVAVLALVKKLWIYGTVFGSLTVILSVINHLKVSANGDNFMPWDISMAGNVGQLTGFVTFSFPPLMFMWISLIALFVVFYWLTDAQIPLKWYFRIPVPVIITVVVISLWNKPVAAEKMLNKFGMSFNDSILQSSNYTANGFVNAFTINCFALKVSEPENYSKQALDDILGEYDTTEAQASPDVVVILSEAFFDARTLNNTEFSENPLNNWDEIISREGAVSGKMYTTAHGGGTVRTEFEVLTGLTVDYLTNGTSPYLYVTNELESYVSNYKDQGYNTIAIHSYDGKFYSRNIAYSLLGFDKFITQTEMAKRKDCTFRRGYITDDTFMNVLIEELENSDSAPNFVFGITMENHQKYAKSDPDDIIIDVTNDSLSEGALDALTTYTQGLYNADKALGKLIDYIDNRERDTVLLYFGDHLPTLGGYHEAYNDAGNVNIDDGYTTEEFKYIYSAPYFIYSNYGADFGDSEQYSEVSTYYLLSLIADKTKTSKTPYMQYLLDNFTALPYYHVRLGMTPEGQNKNFIKNMEHFTYYKLSN